MVNIFVYDTLTLILFALLCSRNLPLHLRTNDAQ